MKKNIRKYNYGLSDKNSKLKMKALFKKEFIQSGGYGVVNNKDNVKNLHTEFAILLYSMMVTKLPQEKVHEIFEEAVNLEIEFVTQTLQCGLLGINADLMSDYVKYVSDRLLVQLNYDKLYNIHKCPLDFMERISITNKSNFFEVRVAEYSLANIDKSNVQLNFEEEDDF